MIAPGARLKDRYRLERLLGRGGMASVWLASDEVLERPVAVKILSDTIASDPEFLARFRREARVAASLTHPNLIGVYDYAEAEERPYLVMEYVPGENLAERMAQGGQIDCERLACELLDALAHIHAAGIVHRDVKTQNVVLAPDDSAKLIDFGIALPKDATALTRTGLLLGTARYIAPEVMRGESATERSDLYSCGMVLRDCAGGDPPGRLGELVKHLSMEDPRRRPKSAAAALSRFERQLAPPGPPTEELTGAAASPRDEHEAAGPRRSRGKAVAALVAAVAVVGGAFLVIGDDGSQQGRGERAGSKLAAADRREKDKGKSEEKGDGAAEAATSETTETPEEEEAEATATVPAAAGTDPSRGSALNEEGFGLIQAGQYEDAVPVLEEAVRAFPADTEDVNYAYALFNLGNALRLSGRPDEAIPILERRLEIPDQTEVVSQELEAARAEASS